MKERVLVVGGRRANGLRPLILPDGSVEWVNDAPADDVLREKYHADVVRRSPDDIDWDAIATEYRSRHGWAEGEQTL